MTLDGGLQLQQVVRAKDGTRKLVFKLTTGEGAGGQVEAVLIPVVRQAGLRDRVTLCVSSQVGFGSLLQKYVEKCVVLFSFFWKFLHVRRRKVWGPVFFPMIYIGPFFFLFFFEPTHDSSGFP